jgi:hypothetical protein
MTAPAPLRPKSAPAPTEIRRAPQSLASSPSPQSLSASVKLGGAHDAEEHEANAAAAAISAGGRHRVSDPGAGGHLRAQSAPKLLDPAAAGRVRAAPVEKVVDPGASGRIRSSPAEGADTGAAGQIRRLPAPNSLRARDRAKAATKVEQARRSPSRPLPETVRARLEHGFGQSLHSVGVHTGPPARSAASAIGARAYTEGERITLGHGQSEHDLRLMAHETAHVIQNRRAAGVFRPLPESAPARAEPETRPQEKPPGLLRRAAASESVRAAPEIAGPIRRLSFDDALDEIADKANFIPGFRLLTVILGKNPINGAEVERNGANILRAAIDFLPGGELIVRGLDKYGVIDKAGAFIDAQVKSLGMAASSIRDALMDFIHSLDVTDLLDLGGVWERAKAVFTGPINKVKAFFVGVAEAVIQFIKDAVLKPLAALASKTPAWDILCAVLGKDPITGDAAPPLGDAIVGGLLKMAGQEEVWQNIQKSGAKGRIIAWVTTNIAVLKGFVQEIPSLFINALKSFNIESLLDLPGAFGKVVGIFGDFAGRFISWVGTAVWDLLKIVFDVVSPGAWAYIQRTGAALKSILKNPLPFVHNLVAAAKLGLSNFADNVGDHLKTALLDWLTGSLPGVYIPKAFSLGEFGKLALSVLGISWLQIRGKIVKALGAGGDMIMNGLEKAFVVIKALKDGGPGAAWEAIKEQLSNLKDMLVDGIVGFVTDTIVKKAIPKLVSMFIPGAGFIAAIVSIYDTVKSFIAQVKKVAAAVAAFVDGIVAIAAGQIAGAAKKVESSLANALSLAIGLLAGFLGLGNVAEKLRGIIAKVQDKVDKALDKAINFIVAKAKALFAKLFGGKDKKDDDPEKAAKVRAGKEALRAATQARAQDGAIKHDDATAIAAEVRGNHPVFKSVKVVDGGESWTFEFVASPPERMTADKKPIFENPDQIYRLIYDMAKERFAAARGQVKARSPQEDGASDGRIILNPGEHPSVLGAQIRDRAPNEVPKRGSTVPIQVETGVPVFARQGSGAQNVIISGLGTYEEIVVKLQGQGLTGPALTAAVTAAVTQQGGERDAQRVAALLHGAEPARREIAGVQSDLALIASRQDLSVAPLLGGANPIYPPAVRGFAKIDARSEATVIGGAQFPVRTKIAVASDENLARNVQLVYQATKNRQFKNADELRSVVLQLLNQFDQARAIG